MAETNELTEAIIDRDRFHQDYLNACRLVAEMHKAAVGEVRGPIRGVVEDVTDLRAERDLLATTLADVLREFQFKTHPGRACLQTGHVAMETVEGWRAVLGGGRRG